MTPTLATPRNMKRTKDGHRNRGVVALDTETGETFSASPGDYWTIPDDEPLRGAGDTPLVLVVPFTRYRDALTGETL